MGLRAARKFPVMARCRAFRRRRAGRCVSGRGIVSPGNPLQASASLPSRRPPIGVGPEASTAVGRRDTAGPEGRAVGRYRLANLDILPKTPACKEVGRTRVGLALRIGSLRAPYAA